MVQKAMKDAKMSAWVMAARLSVGNSIHNPASEAIRRA